MLSLIEGYIGIGIGIIIILLIWWPLKHQRIRSIVLSIHIWHTWIFSLYTSTAWIRFELIRCIHDWAAVVIHDYTRGLLRLEVLFEAHPMLLLLLLLLLVILIVAFKSSVKLIEKLLLRLLERLFLLLTQNRRQNRFDLTQSAFVMERGPKIWDLRLLTY